MGRSAQGVTRALEVGRSVKPRATSQSPVCYTDGPDLPGQPLDDLPRYAPPGYTHIYALIDPRDLTIRYVGKSISAARRAHQHHYSRDKHAATNERKKAWHGELDELDLKPMVRILAVVPLEEWRAQEIRLIAELREQGQPLLNATRGGDGLAERWTLERIEMELREFCAGRAEWPTGDEFTIAGQDSLSQAVNTHGGHDHWAATIGLPRLRAMPRSEERILAELAAICVGRKTFPTFRDFDEAGTYELYDTVVKLGGLKYWADKMGLRFDQKEPWTEASLRRELDDFCKSRTVFPSKVELEATGLINAVRKFGGREYWAKSFGLPLHKPKWSDELIRYELAAFCAGRADWPATAEFRQAGLSGLNLLRVVQKHGGVTRWAAELGLTLTHPVTGKRKPRASKDLHEREEKLRRELQAFCAGWETFPPFREFVKHEKAHLYQQARRLGGLERWVKEMGLEKVAERTSWTDELLLARLQELCRGRSTFPTQRELSRAGLANPVARSGCSARWAKELGLPLTQQPWTDDQIREELRPLCTGRKDWPTVVELTQQGGCRLTAAIQRHGGATRWAAEFGLYLHHNPHHRAATHRKRQQPQHGVTS